MTYPEAGIAPCHYCDQISVVVVNGRPACGGHVDQIFDDALGPVILAVRGERCRACDEPVKVQIFMGTGFCSVDCQKVGAPTDA